jgi:HEAT repeat protein
MATPLVALSDDDIGELLTRIESPKVKERRKAARTLSHIGGRATEALPALIKALDDKDEQVRAHALAAITQLGPSARPAIPRLIVALNSKQPQVRYRSALALGQVGPAAVGPLIEAFDSNSVEQKIGAAMALARIGPDAVGAVNRLVHALGDADPRVHDEAARALGQVGLKSVPPTLAALSTGNTSVRSGALLVLSEIGPDARGEASAIRKFVTDEAPKVRIRAAQALAHIGVAQSELIEVLVELIQDDHDDVQYAAGELFMLVRPREAAVPHLTRLIEAEDTAVALRAATLLSRFGRVAESAVPSLVKATARLGEQDADAVLPKALGIFGEVAVKDIITGLAISQHPEKTLRRYVDAMTLTGTGPIPSLVIALSHKSPQVRSGAVLTLGASGKTAEHLVPNIITLLDDDDAFVRASASEALGDLGLVARAAAPILAEKLEDTDPRVRAAAVIGLGKTAGDDVTYTDLFASAIKADDVSVRIAATRVMSKLPAVTAASVENLVAALIDENEHVRAGSARALGAAGKDTASSVPALVQLLKDPISAVRTEVAQALGSIGETTPGMLADLGVAIADPSPKVRRQVVLTLRQLGPAAQPAVPQLVEALDNQNSDFRILVIESFRPIISDVSELLKPLLKATKDSDREVRRTAAYEIGEIGETAQEAVPALFLMIEDDVDRYAARAAVNKISPRDVPLLIKKMTNESPFVRLTACEALNTLGPDAAEALEFLEGRLADKALQKQAETGGDYGIRRCISETVKKLMQVK